MKPHFYHKDLKHTFGWILGWVSAMAACTSCDHTTDTDVPNAEQGTPTYIQLNFSTSLSAYQAEKTTEQDELNTGSDAENKIYSIQVWAFNSGNTNKQAVPIGYTEATDIDANGSYTIGMKLLAADMEYIDIYALANGASGNISLTQGNDLQWKTRGELEQATIGNLFGVANTGYAQNVSVPQSGLPMSRIITRIPLSQYKSNTASGKTALNIPLLRSVSKLHLFFARKKNADTDQINITRVELGANTLGKETYTFAYPISDESGLKYLNATVAWMPSPSRYETSTIKYGSISTQNILETDNPEIFKRADGENAESYLTRLAQSGLKESCLSYFRETDKEVKGTIYFKYTPADHERSVSFRIKEGLIRNHEYVIYAYALNGHFIVESTLLYQVLPWEGKTSTDIEFN